MSGSLDQQVKPGHLLSLRSLYCGEDTAKPARGGRAAAAVQPRSSHTIARCALSLPEVRALSPRCALSFGGVRSLRPRGALSPRPRGALSPRTGVRSLPARGCAPSPRGGALSLSEARSLLLSPQCALSLPPPQFSGSLICWVTRPIKVKVTCARSGQANHHTDHALSTRHPRTPGPITADFL